MYCIFLERGRKIHLSISLITIIKLDIKKDMIFSLIKSCSYSFSTLKIWLRMGSMPDFIIIFLYQVSNITTFINIMKHDNI